MLNVLRQIGSELTCLKMLHSDWLSPNRLKNVLSNESLGSVRISHLLAPCGWFQSLGSADPVQGRSPAINHFDAALYLYEL